MRRLPAVLMMVIGLFVLGCEKKPVALVDGEKITEEMLQRQVNASMMEHGAQGVKVDPNALRQVALEQVIAQRLLLQGARENKIEVSDDEVNTKVEEARAARGEEAFKKDLADGNMTIEQFRRSLKEKLVLNRFIASLAPEDSITEEDVVNYYRESPTPFLRPEEVNIRVIQVHHPEQADTIAKELDKAKDFDKIANTLNEEKGAVVMGYGWTTPGVFDPTIAEAMRETKVGKFSGPHKGTGGFYFFHIKEKRSEGVKTLDEAREEIRAALLRNARQLASMHWVAERKKIAAIKIN